MNASWDCQYLHNECSWTWIECDDNNDKILGIDMSDFLITSLPTSVLRLTALTSLYLTNNQLDFKTLSFLAQMKNLQVLDLSYNDYQGSIPTFISSLTNLIELDMSNNQLTGSIQGKFNSLSKLQILNLSTNSLDSYIPTDLINLKSLKVRYIYIYPLKKITILTFDYIYYTEFEIR